MTVMFSLFFFLFANFTSPSSLSLSLTLFIDSYLFISNEKYFMLDLILSFNCCVVSVSMFCSAVLLFYSSIVFLFFFFVIYLFEFLNEIIHLLRKRRFHHSFCSFTSSRDRCFIDASVSHNRLLFFKSNRRSICS